MKYYVIINGNSSLDIQGLAIESLPNISKPLIRTSREEIDGRDGDIITKLGYSAYDKTLNIGLWGNYDINEVIAYFNEDGVITFSNEPDKYYKFHILNRIDFVNQLEKFKKASITIHCQPFKYKEQEAKVIEEEEHTTSGTSFNLSDTLEAPLEIDLKGNTSQTGTPTPSSPIPINNVSGDNDIEVCEENIYNYDNDTNYSHLYLDGSGNFQTDNTTNYVNEKINILKNTISIYIGSKSGNANIRLGQFKSDGTFISRILINQTTNNITFDSECSYIWLSSNKDITTNYYFTNVSLIYGSSISSYIPYTGTTYNIDLPVENLFDGELELGTYNDSGVKYNSNTNYRNENIISVKPNTTYTFSINGVSQKYGIYYYNSSKTFISAEGLTTGTFTTPNNCFYLNFRCFNADFTSDYANLKVQLELGSKANTYTPYGTTPIELNKIGTYQDYIYKENDKWYLHKETGKVVLDGSEEGWDYNFNCFRMLNSTFKVYDTTVTGEIYSNYFIKNSQQNLQNNIVDYGISYRGTNGYLIRNKDITSINNFKVWLSTHNTSIYYILETPTNTEITYTPLIEQLNTLEEAQSYEGTTNINQVNNDLPFIIDLTYYTGDTSITITNDGNIYSKPLLELKGTGNINIYLNGIQVFVVSLNDEIIYIDTDKMEAYYQGTLKNRQVVGDYNNFKLQSGNNTIQVDGGYVEYLKITNYSRWV